MKVEIIEFYPNNISLKGKPKVGKAKKYLMKGTLHVYLPDLKLDLRGMNVKVNTPKNFYITPVMGKAYDFETKEWRTFPYVTFSDPKDFVDMIDSIKEAFQEFLKGYKPPEVVIEQKKAPRCFFNYKESKWETAVNVKKPKKKKNPNEKAIGSQENKPPETNA